MKKLFAICLLAIHLFYLGGYNLIFQYFIHRSEVQIVKQIYENKVDATQLIQIKLPVHMPNIKDWPDYERLQGQIQLKDAYYNYLGVKLTRDTMYLVCIANSVKTHLVSANLIVAKNASDVPLSKKGEAPITKKVSSPSDYTVPASGFNFSGFSQSVANNTNSITTVLTDPYIESPGKPPNFFC
ncbi:hypothetical protein [Mucilaginibacter segetis]|uniref:Uncharacterized protein n=1 Tax=Mucilaginibacter segetis TaxID=2793071 RepID=A0A934PQW2_9SPHI|nr:hypothetical protein [Mucilaginibacter segetis]MBK0379098.1 hypothetical protein [Mucilaginibacter segetis]